MSAKQALVLYVDDERPNRIVFEQSFTGRFHIKTAANGTEALAILQQENVGVLITDQRMPDMSGNELLERAKELRPEVVRIVVTAYSDLDPILEAVNEGLVARYLIKPWDRDELEQILEWGMEAFTLGQQSSALQLRLMQTERLVTLGSIGAAVIHDINQPLSYLLSNTERLNQLARSAAALADLVTQHGASLAPEDRASLADLSAELPDIVGDMLEGCRVMHGLTSTIRRLLRPSAPTEVPVIDPMPVIRYALSACRDIALKARGNLSYDGPPQLAGVRIGSTELTQVLINLLANGAQALARREKPGGRVTIAADERDEVVLFAVQDDGPGMSEEVLKKVGTPFFSTRKEGTGLGVAQCRRLVEQAGGTLHIDSQLGRGTRVEFTVPKA